MPLAGLKPIPLACQPFEFLLGYGQWALQL
jgi:hypothetical protein